MLKNQTGLLKGERRDQTEEHPTASVHHGILGRLTQGSTVSFPLSPQQITMNLVTKEYHFVVHHLPIHPSNLPTPMSTWIQFPELTEEETNQGPHSLGCGLSFTAIILPTIIVYPETYKKNSHWFLKGKKAHQEAMNLKKKKKQWGDMGDFGGRKGRRNAIIL